MLKNFIKNRVEKVRLFSEKYKLYIMPAVLIIGFLLDFLTLRRVDGLFDNILLSTHLLIVGFSIVLLFSKDTRFGEKLKILKHSQKIEYVMLFSFGALFSGSIIFFSKSASLSSSWPFFLLLLILMLGTEFQKKYFQRLVLQINFYYIAVLSYLIVLIPVVTRKMGPDIFILSGILSLVSMVGFFFILSVADRRKMKIYSRKMIFGVGSIFLFFNFLYFSNIIPPIPLSLKFIDVYHSVYRVSSTNYVGSYEPTPPIYFWDKRSSVVHREPNGSVYVFSSVFAPTNLNTDIYHQWQYFDEVKKEWIDSSKIKLGVSGGRDDGFRGYSFKRSLTNGTWRVVVETERGQKLGQKKFKIVPKEGSVKLQEELL